MSHTLQAVLDYLHGAAELEGLWYGEEEPKNVKPFWWRQHLPRVAPASTLGAADAAMLRAIFRLATVNGDFSVSKDRKNGGFVVTTGSTKAAGKSITAAVTHLLKEVQ